MENIIGLSFNLVTLLDSRAIQKDSKSMKTIAFMTMFFLPVSTVATIFGAQFFTVGSEAPSHLQISPDFWILWAFYPCGAYCMATVAFESKRQLGEGTTTSWRCRGSGPRVEGMARENG